MENKKNEKITMAKQYARVIAVINDTEVEDKEALVKFLQGRLEKLDSKNRKPTKAQKENEALKEVILERLAGFETPATINEIKDCEELEEYETQKISALLTQLKKAGKVEPHKGKGKDKMRYSLVLELELFNAEDLAEEATEKVEPTDLGEFTVEDELE